jgi:hypothetical protein
MDEHKLDLDKVAELIAEVNGKTVAEVRTMLIKACHDGRLSILGERVQSTPDTMRDWMH